MSTTARSTRRLARGLAAAVAGLGIVGGAFVGTAQAAPSDAAPAAASTTTSEAQPAPTIARDEVIKRARVWLTANDGGKVPYSQEDLWSDGYRQDCSGFVSMAWGLDPAGGGGPNTVGLAADHAVDIAKEQLQPGDVLMNDQNGGGTPNNRHVVIFNGWVDDSMQAYHGIEQSGSADGTTERDIPYPYDSTPEKYRPMHGKVVE